MTVENPKPIYLSEKVIIKDNWVYVYLLVSILPALFCALFLMVIPSIFIVAAFGFDRLLLALGFVSLVVLGCGALCWLMLLIPIIFRNHIILSRGAYLAYSIVIWPIILLAFSYLNIDLIPSSLTTLLFGAVSSVLGMLLFLNLLDQSDRPFKYIKIGFGPKDKEPTKEEKAAIEKLKKLSSWR